MSMAVDNRARATARVGMVLKDKWRLDALLGIGGMAVVYSATHRNHKRVAIKMLLPELAGDADIRARFVREGYAANKIEHPGALSVLDDDVAEEGLPFLVMELLEGETVEARWNATGQRMDLAEVLAIAGAVLDVLIAAHEKGVVHRDIKPENLFLLRTGGLKVLDFGIARVLEGARSRTETRAGTVMGTPAFMAPEQALAKWDEVDGRTDLWAVAATMFTLLSGQHVHEGANGNEQFVKSATQPARSIATIVKGLPRSVVALVDRALRFDRAARWPDAAAMQEAVKGAYESLTGAPLVIAPPPSSGTVSWVSSSVGPRSGAHQLQPTLPTAKSPALPARAQMASSPGMRAPTSASMRAAPPRRNSGSFENIDPLAMNIGSSPTQNLAPQPMTALGVEAFLAARTAEREAASGEVARHQSIVAEIQGRLSGARRRVAQAQEQIASARKERAAEDDRFRRQMNARLEGVGEARKDFRRAMCEVAELALEDTARFPPDVGSAERVAIEKTAAVAASRRREDALHRAALASFEPVALKRGVGLSAAGIVLLLLLFFSPVIVRSCSSDAGTIAPPTSGETR